MPVPENHAFDGHPHPLDAPTVQNRFKPEPVALVKYFNRHHFFCVLGTRFYVFLHRRFKTALFSDNRILPRLRRRHQRLGSAT
jgi:hypothetical protein